MDDTTAGQPAPEQQPGTQRPQAWTIANSIALISVLVVFYPVIESVAEKMVGHGKEEAAKINQRIDKLEKKVDEKFDKQTKAINKVGGAVNGIAQYIYLRDGKKSEAVTSPNN